MSATFKKYKKDIIFLFVFSVVVLPGLFAAVVFAAGSLSESAINFGDVAVGDIATLPVTFTNTSPSPLEVNVSASGAFGCSGGCSDILGQNSRLVSTLSFNPTAANPYSGTAAFSFSGGATSPFCSANQTPSPTPLNCSQSGITVNHNSSRLFFAASNPAWPTQCRSQNRSCNNGSLSGSYTRPTCINPTPSNCSVGNININHNSSRTFFAASNPTFPTQCQSQRRFCNNGSLSGSFTRNTCINPPTPTCSDGIQNQNETGIDCGGVCGACASIPRSNCFLDGITVSHGGSHGFYLSRNPAWPAGCSRQVRSCNDGSLSGNNSFNRSSCINPTPLNCSVGNININHNSSRTFFAASNPAWPTQCRSQNRSCNNGSLSGSFTRTSCTPPPPPPSNCSVGNININHNSSRTFFAASNPAWPTQCRSQNRSCNNGSLSGSFTRTSCTASPAQNCSVGSININHGASRTFHEASNPAFPNVCRSQNRSCNNGRLSGTFTRTSCTASPAQNCSQSGLTINHNSSRTFFAASNPAWPTQCQSQNRSCNNGSLSGSYTRTSCTPPPLPPLPPPLNCSQSGITVNHNSSRTFFAVSNPAWPTQCQSQSRFCINGNLLGTFTQTSCTPPPTPLNWTIIGTQFCETDGACAGDGCFTTSGTYGGGTRVSNPLTGSCSTPGTVSTQECSGMGNWHTYRCE